MDAVKARQADPGRAAEAERRRAQGEAIRRRNLADHLSSQVGRRYSRDRITLDNYLCHHPGQTQTLRQVRDLAARLPAAVEAGSNLVLFGTPGTGKDHLMLALAYTATGQHGIDCYWTTGVKLYSMLRDAITLKQTVSGLPA